MWTTTHVDRTGGITNVMVNKQNLLRLIDGYCRDTSDKHLPQDIINIVYVFGKQLWTLLGGKYFELFDLVYHSMILPEKIIRTYLHQIVDEIQKNPNMPVVEPTDLLLDESFSIFIVNQVNKTNVNNINLTLLLFIQSCIIIYHTNQNIMNIMGPQILDHIQIQNGLWNSYRK